MPHTNTIEMKPHPVEIMQNKTSKGCLLRFSGPLSDISFPDSLVTTTVP